MLDSKELARHVLRARQLYRDDPCEANRILKEEWEAEYRKAIVIEKKRKDMDASIGFFAPLQRRSKDDLESN